MTTTPPPAPEREWLETPAAGWALIAAAGLGAALLLFGAVRWVSSSDDRDQAGATAAQVAELRDESDDLADRTRELEAGVAGEVAAAAAIDDAIDEVESDLDSLIGTIQDNVQAGNLLLRCQNDATSFQGIATCYGQLLPAVKDRTDDEATAFEDLKQHTDDLGEEVTP